MSTRSPQPPGWGDLLLRWTLHLVAADRTAQTIETRTEHMRRIARAFPEGPQALTPAEWERWSGSHSWATETRRSFTATIRSFYAWHDGSDPTATVPPIRPAIPQPRPIPDDLLLPALARADDRTRLVLRLAAECGLRRTEIAALPSTALDTAGAQAVLRIVGKGRKPRTVPVPAPLAYELAKQLGPWVFPGPTGHLTPRHIGALAKRALPEGWTLHTLRHRYAAEAYRDRNILAVQRLLGHVSPATTQRYVPTPMEELVAAAMLAQIYR